VALATHTSRHIGYTWRGAHAVPSNAQEDPGRCRDPGRDLGAHLGGPSRRTPVDDSPDPWRRTLPDGQAPFAFQRPSSGVAFTFKAVSLYPAPTRQAINGIDGQCEKGSNPIDLNSDSELRFS
jgi:hypothetical protein